jgi:hypothetical protein
MRRYLTLVVTWVLVAPANAVAATTSAEQVGSNLGHILTGWAKALFIAIAMFSGIKFLFNHKYSDMAIFVIALVVIGGLIYSPGQVETMIRGFWTSLTG